MSEGKLFIGGLSLKTEEATVREAFSKYGAISDCVVFKEGETGISRGYGFVVFENQEDAKEAEKGLNETDMDGRTVTVQPANARGDYSGFGGYGGRGGYGYGDRGGYGYAGGGDSGQD